MELHHPIRAVARMTGIAVDTLRAWERRYGTVVPARGRRGRQYSDADVQRLRLLRTAVSMGHSIGQAASLTDTQLRRLIQRADEIGLDAVSMRNPQARREPSAILEPVLAAVDAMDYGECKRHMGRLAALMSPGELVHQVVLPLMHVIGERWHDGELSVAQEHMASALMRDLLGSLLRLYVPAPAAASVLLTTPSGELHEFGILAAAMLAAANGLSVFYLGPNLPAGEIVAAARRISTDVVVLGLSGDLWRRSVPQIQRIARDLPDHIELWIGGNIEAIRRSRLAPERVILLADFQALESRLSRLLIARRGSASSAAQRWKITE
ncbi:MAG: MerR family transcriptional regulator [Acidobacteria bacterium]|nr:MerR family transcriptional regulator [Acidobacteriota bacterium]